MAPRKTVRGQRNPAVDMRMRKTLTQGVLPGTDVPTGKAMPERYRVVGLENTRRLLAQLKGDQS